MTELYRLTTNGVARVPERDFVNEVADLEDFIVRNPSLLGEGTSIVARQVNAGGAGRLDILAVSEAPSGRQVAVVELKNTAADIHVLLQALRYASWAVTNPDSVRLLLSNARVDPKDVDLRPKIVVVAPAVQDELVELSQYVSAFEFEFVEVKRFAEKDESLVVITHKVPSVSPSTVVTVREEWDWERYKTELGWKEERVALGRHLLERVQSIVELKRWSLEPRFRKWYVPFQLAGTRNVFGISAKSAHDWWLWFRLPASPEDLGLPRIPYQSKWEPGWKGFSVVIDKPEADLEVLDQYFEAAYKGVTRESM